VYIVHCAREVVQFGTGFARFWQLDLQPIQNMIGCQSALPRSAQAPSTHSAQALELYRRSPGTRIEARHKGKSTTALRLRGSATETRGSTRSWRQTGFIDTVNVVVAGVGVDAALRKQQSVQLALRICRRSGSEFMMNDGLVVFPYDSDSEFLGIDLAGNAQEEQKGNVQICRPI
jgi:hypothetical protein